ncbi:MAG: hypothetical protein ACRD99_03190 [Nitrososphaera sp.]
MTLNSVFASRKRNAEDEKSGQPTMGPSHFQVYTKIDEEARKDNKLTISFLLTLNDTRGVVTYEFRGICIVTGTAADFESIMETSKNSRVPKILDVLYQKLYPAMFMLAGMTSSSFPQSVALLTDMVSNEPIAVRQELTAVAEGHDSKSDSTAKVAPKPAIPRPSAVKSSAPRIVSEQKPIGARPKAEIDKPAA